MLSLFGFSCMYVISELTNGGSSLRKTYSPSLSSHYSTNALFLGVELHEIFPFHVSMSSDVAVHIFFRQP